MMDSPTVSVVIPTYNRATTLARALKSVLKQNFRDFEIIVVDDGSFDETDTSVKEFIRGAPDEIRISYLRQINRGVSSARNKGIRKALGKWVAFLDSDDEWLPKKLELQIRFLEENPTVKIVHGEEIWIRNGTRVNPKLKHQKSGGFIFKQCLPLCVISPSAVLIEKTLLDKVGLFDEEFPVCEDYDLWLRVTSIARVGFIETPIVVKHGGDGDQLSRKHVAMDYWRVKALDRILKIRDLDDGSRDAASEQIRFKAKILLDGYLKRGNVGPHYQEIRRMLEITPPGPKGQNNPMLAPTSGSSAPLR